MYESSDNHTSSPRVSLNHLVDCSHAAVRNSSLCSNTLLMLSVLNLRGYNTGVARLEA